MTTFRIQKTENYVVLDKGFLNNKELSWQAKGLLAYMLSLPNDWVFNIADLSKRSKNGRDATKTTVNELYAAGYIKKKQLRAEKGKFGMTELLVFETPLTENPSTDNPLTENPSTGNPSTENPSLLSNKLLSNELLNNKLLNDDDDKGEAPNPSKPKEQTAFQFYEENGFGALASHVSYKLGNWIDDLSEELVIEAMKLAVENNALRWNYVDKILQDWRNKKFTTLADVNADKLRYEAQKQQKNGYAGKRQNRPENIPEWFNKRNETANATSNEDQIDFEAEKQKILEKLGRD